MDRAHHPDRLVSEDGKADYRGVRTAGTAGPDVRAGSMSMDAERLAPIRLDPAEPVVNDGPDGRATGMAPRRHGKSHRLSNDAGCQIRGRIGVVA